MPMLLAGKNGKGLLEMVIDIDYSNQQKLMLAVDRYNDPQFLEGYQSLSDFILRLTSLFIIKKKSLLKNYNWFNILHRETNI